MLEQMAKRVLATAIHTVVDSKVLESYCDKEKSLHIVFLSSFGKHYRVTFNGYQIIVDEYHNSLQPHTIKVISL